MSDVKQLLESMIESKEALDKSIELLLAQSARLCFRQDTISKSQNFSIVSNYSSWNPKDDTIWAFKIYYINKINPKELITEFCCNDQLICPNNGTIVCPIGLFDDGGTKLERVINSALEGIKVRHKNTGWGKYDDRVDSYTCPLNQGLDHVEKITSLGKVTLEGSVIFHVHNADFTTVIEIEKFLTGLNSCPKRKKVGMIHFKVSGESVTVFEYICESG